MKNQLTFANGQVLGTIAFNSGLKRVPCLDVELSRIFEESNCQIGEGIKITKGWLFGWDNANLANKVN